jgi:hypothetical protein
VPNRKLRAQIFKCVVNAATSAYLVTPPFTPTLLQKSCQQAIRNARHTATVVNADSFASMRRVVAECGQPLLESVDRGLRLSDFVFGAGELLAQALRFAR